MPPAARLLDSIVPLVCTRLPRGVDEAYLDGFLDRNRSALERILEQNLGPLLARMEAANRPLVPTPDVPLELWTAAKRIAANLAAMAVAARLRAEPRAPRVKKRTTLVGRSFDSAIDVVSKAGRLLM